MAYNSKETDNYEHKSGSTNEGTASITVEDIDDNNPIDVDNLHTVKNIFDGLNKIIKAIKNKFSQIYNNMLGVCGSFELPEHSDSTDEYSITRTYTISNLDKEYTRAYFVFINAAGESVFGAPAVWAKSFGQVYFFNNTVPTGYNLSRYFVLDPYFKGDAASASTKNYVQLQKFEVSYDDTNNTMSIELSIKGSEATFSGYTLKYELF